MNDRTSRRSFVALATGALTSLAAGLGRAFSQGATGHADPRFDAATLDAVSDALSVTTYTYDVQSRLLSVTESTAPLFNSFRYDDA